MTYATPQAYLQRFGRAEALQMLADEEQLLTEQLLKDALAGTWTGTPSADEQAAAVAALARLQRVLETTSSVMDSYLAAVTTVPIADGGPNAGVLEDCCLALARCSLADDCDNATDRMDKACDTWRTWLTNVAKRVVTLAGLDGGDTGTTTGTGSVRYGQAASGYDWQAFGGH